MRVAVMVRTRLGLEFIVRIPIWVGKLAVRHPKIYIISTVLVQKYVSPRR